MKLDKFRKDADNRMRMVIDYSDWLNDGEKAVSSVFTGDVPADNFYIDGTLVDPGGLQVIFYVSGGVAGKSYDVSFTTTTTLAQIKQDAVTFVVT